MTIEDQLRQDLHAVRALPVHDEMANDVLTSLRRQRRMRTAGVGVAAALALAVAIPVVSARLAGPDPGPGSGPTPTATPTDVRPEPEPQFARPGGGPRAIHLYRTDTTKSYLLDVQRGRYVAIGSDSVALSPDLTKVAINGPDGRLAVTDRAALLANGEASLHWTDITGFRPVWSPDGKSVLVTDAEKTETTTTLFARRYDVETGGSRSTQLPGDAIDVGWAADSTGYLVFRSTQAPGGGLKPGALQYLAPDGMWGPTVIADLAGSVVAYSPSSRYLLTDSSQIDTDTRPPSKILEVATNAVVAETVGTPVGWYDDTHFIRLVNGHRVEVVDLATGAVTRSFEFEGPLRDHTLGLEFGPSTGLAGEAAASGF